jgi:hypothetical protein
MAKQRQHKGYYTLGVVVTALDKFKGTELRYRFNADEMRYD